MERQANSLHNSVDRLTQLELENKALREELILLRAREQSAIDNLEKRLVFEEAYQESQQRFKTVFEQSKLGNKIITSDLRIILVNHALQVMLGYSEKELVGTNIVAYAHPDFVDSWREIQKNLWEKRIPSFGIQTCLVRKDGAIIWCNVTSILFSQGNDTLGYTIVEDITERKLVEEKLKKLYDSQEIVVHSVAHDLKNPIHIIQTLNSFLKTNIESFQEVDTNTKNQSLSFIEMIEGSCDKAYAIIKDLLLIGEIELDNKPLKREKTAMTSFVEKELNRFQWEAAHKGIAINVDFPTEEVYADINRDKFARVVENLLSNAIKFTKQGGQVKVCLKGEPQSIILQVSDSGIGIPEALQNSVFHKFTKANRQGTQGEETTGLGLFIVKQVVDLHKGKVWFESKENQGTSFYVELEQG